MEFEYLENQRVVRFLCAVPINIITANNCKIIIIEIITTSIRIIIRPLPINQSNVSVSHKTIIHINIIIQENNAIFALLSL